MKKSKFAEPQIAYALRQAESDISSLTTSPQDRVSSR